MQISFSTRELRAYCVEPTGGRLDAEGIRLLEARIADLQAVENLTNLVVGSPELRTASPDRILIAIGLSHYLVCRIDHEVVRYDTDGEVAWNNTDRIMIESIEQRDGEH